MRARDFIVEQQPQQAPNIRQVMNNYMDKDQQLNRNPPARISLQKQVWPVIQKNLQAILADVGDKGDGDYPSAAFAAWLLVQHMDAFPQNQVSFYQALARAIPNFPKLQYLRDRAAVNQAILRLNNPQKYKDKNGQPLKNPTMDVRDPSKFDDAGMAAGSQQEALANAQQAGNNLLVDAVKAAGATTQPSFQS